MVSALEMGHDDSAFWPAGLVAGPLWLWVRVGGVLRTGELGRGRLLRWSLDLGGPALSICESDGAWERHGRRDMLGAMAKSRMTQVSPLIIACSALQAVRTGD